MRGHPEVPQDQEGMSGRGVGGQRAGSPGRHPPGPAVLPGVPPALCCAWQLLALLGVPSCAPPTALHRTVTHCWPGRTLSWASPHSVLPKPPVFAPAGPCPLAWPPDPTQHPKHLARTPASPGRETCPVPLRTGAAAPTVLVHGPSCRPARLCQAPSPLWASWAGRDPSQPECRVWGVGSALGTLWVLGQNPCWRGPHPHHGRGRPHMCGHVRESGGWQAHLAPCPWLIVGFSCDGGGGTGVTAEALTG